MPRVRIVSDVIPVGGLASAMTRGVSGRARSRSGEHGYVRPVNVLHRVERDVFITRVIIVKFKNAPDMRMHQPDTELPFASEYLYYGILINEYFQRHRRACQLVRCKPGFRTAARAEFSIKCVPTGELRPAL